MIGSEIRDMFSEIAKDDMSDTQAYIFMNACKDIIESYRDWNFNRAFDSSNTVAAGDNYLTAKTLPATFLSPRKLYFQGDLTPLNLISFEERERYKDVYRRWYIDWLNRQFFVCGASGAVGRTLNLYFARQSPNITATTSPVWPESYHPILGFLMANMFQAGSDTDLEGIAAKAAMQNLGHGTDLLKSMVKWDAKIKTMEYNDRNQRNVDLSSHPDVVGGEFIF